MSEFFNKNIPNNILTALSARGNANTSNVSFDGASNSSVFKWEHDKHHWVRVISQVSIDGEKQVNGGMLRDTWALYGGKHNIEKLFGVSGVYDSAKYGNIPRPGLTSVTIENKGSMGATKKVTIKYICWSKQQLQALEPLYMTLGKYIFVEFGWDKILSGDAVGNINLKPLTIKHNLTTIGSIKRYVEVARDNIKLENNTYGCHSIYQGVVTGFNWAMRPDGGFDCETVLVSPGETFLSTNVSVQDKKLPTSSITMTDKGASINKDNKKTESDISAIFSTLLKHAEDSKENSSKIRGWGSQPFTAYSFALDTRTGFWSIFWESEKHTFIKFEELLKILNYCFGRKPINEDEPLIQFDDKNDILVTYKPGMISTDARICLIPGAIKPIVPQKLNMKIPGSLANFSAGVSNAVARDDSMSLAFIDTTFFNDIYQRQKINLQKFLINVDFLYKLIIDNPEQSVGDFVNTVLSSISNSCGGYWNFILDPEPDNHSENYAETQPTSKTLSIKIYEQSAVIDPDIDVNKYEFNLFNRHSIIKSANFSTDLSSKVANAVIAQTNSNSFSGTNAKGRQETEYAFFGYKVKDLTPEANSTYVKTVSNSNSTPTSNTNTSDDIDVVESYANALSDYISFIDDTSVESLKSSMNQYIKYHNDIVHCGKTKLSELKSLEEKWTAQRNMAFTGPVLLPLKLSLTLDGIAGLKPGNIITTDYIPERYKDTTYYKGGFMINNIVHEITPDTWDTRIETNFYYKPIA